VTHRDPLTRSAADPERRRFELLATVGEKLGASLDPAITVQNIVQALVPAFADWCVVDLIGPDRGLETVASAHRDPDLVAEIARLRSEYPPRDRREPIHAIYRAIDQDATIVETVEEVDLRGRAVDADHLALLHRLGIGSHVVVALESRGRVIGALSVIRRPEREPFDADDVVTAEEIARRAALATDNAQLYRAAQEAIELRDRFIALASHELRNPLAVVNGHWELLGRRLGRIGEALPPDELEKIEASMVRLGQGIDQLRRMVEELLDVKRMTRGEMELRRGPVDLAAIVRQTAEELSEADGAERVRLRLPEAPVIGSWDRGRLEQVVANLLANALKYSPPEQVVEVVLEASEDLAHLRVTDAGIGIPADELDMVFEPFKRGRSAEAHHYPGLGLGLSVSREIVAMHGGRMWAESGGEGRGSTFVVELARRMS
jgi:signal transduction histidine kinase